MFLHVDEVASKGFKHVIIKTKDTDVVIGIQMFSESVLDELWIDLDFGKHRKWIPIHQLYLVLGEKRLAWLCHFGMPSSDVTVLLVEGRRLLGTH